MNLPTTSARITDALEVGSPELDELIRRMRWAKWFWPLIALVVVAVPLLDPTHWQWSVAIGLAIGFVGFGVVSCYEANPSSLRALYLMIDGSSLSVGLLLTAGFEEITRSSHPNNYWLIERYWYAYLIAGVAVFLYSAMWAPWVPKNRTTMARLASYVPRAIPSSELFGVMFPSTEGRRRLRNMLVGTATGGGLVGIALPGDDLVLLFIPSLLIGSHVMGVAIGHLARFFRAFGAHDLQILDLATTRSLPWQTRLRQNFRGLRIPARIALFAGLLAAVFAAAASIVEGHEIGVAFIFPGVWVLGATIILLPGRRSFFAELAMVGWIAICFPLVPVVIGVVWALVD
jgi:hypothetical protein